SIKSIAYTPDNHAIAILNHDKSAYLLRYQLDKHNKPNQNHTQPNAKLRLGDNTNARDILAKPSGNYAYVNYRSSWNHTDKKATRSDLASFNVGNSALLLITPGMKVPSPNYDTGPIQGDVQYVGMSVNTDNNALYLTYEDMALNVVRCSLSDGELGGFTHLLYLKQGQ